MALDIAEGAADIAHKLTNVSAKDFISKASLKDIVVPAEELAYNIDFVHSTIFPLIYAALISGQKYTPKTTSKPKKKYDYIVVGAGSAGAVIAARLSEEPCVNVLVLEAGKSPPFLTEIPILDRLMASTDLNWDYRTTPQKHTGRSLNNRQAVYGCGKTIGGGSTINDMIYSRGSRHIYDSWNVSGWSYSDLLPYFMKMEQNMNLDSVDPGYHGSEGPITVTRPVFETDHKDGMKRAIKELRYPIVDPNGEFPSGFYPYQSTLRDGQRCSTAKGYLVPADNRTNLHIVDRAFVTKIIINKNKRAVGVEYEKFGKKFRVCARKEVILSAGCIRTPQLLMLAGIGPKDHLQEMKIPVIVDLPVGNNFHDHVGSANIYHSKKQPHLVLQALDPSIYYEYITNRTGFLSAPSTLQYVAFFNDKDCYAREKSPNIQLLFIQGITYGIKLQANVNEKTYLQSFAQYELEGQMWCIAIALEIKSRGTIRLSSLDPKEPPLINPNYCAEKEDIKAVVNALKECDRIFNSHALRSMGFRPIDNPLPGCEDHKLFSDEYYTCQVKSLNIAIMHGVASAKMGNPDDATAVVTPDLRVKGITGLRVVDGSAIPIVPSGNTNAPIITLAEKAADIIKDTIQCKSKDN